MPNLILFDDPTIRTALLPLTFTRPVAGIRVGIHTLAEKWSSQLGQPASFQTQHYLQTKFPAQVSDDNLYINGAVCPTDELVTTVKQLAWGDELRLPTDELIAVRTSSFPETAHHPRTPDYSSGTRVFTGALTIIRHLPDIFLQNGAEIRADFAQLTAGRTSQPVTDPFTRCYAPENIFVEPGAVIRAAVLNAENGPIYIGKNATVQEGSIMIGPFALCDNATVNWGGKMRSNTTIGPWCKVGGEVGNSVLFGYSNKAHDGFLGNSVIGEWCNLGANVNNSNLKNDYTNVKLHSYATNQLEDTGRLFCGLMMGDYTKAGISTMFNTGTVVGVNVNVFGTGFQPKHIPSFSWGGAAEGFTNYRIEKALQVARETVSRRGIDFGRSTKLFCAPSTPTMLFNEIIGYDATKETLLRVVQTNHLAHALLFDGPLGSGNLALALSLATYVNCENKQGDSPGADACGRCASCAKMQKLVHPDLHLVFPVANLANKGKTSEAFLVDWRKFILENPYRTLPEWLDYIDADNKQGNITAEEARNILQKLSLKAYEGAYKIMLIWLPEFLNIASANALLKVLEEPPGQTLFLLVTNQPDKLLVTILSRTQRVAIRPFTDNEVAMHLRQHLNLDEVKATKLAYLANGNLSAAIQLAKAGDDRTDGGTGGNSHTWFAEWMRLCYRQDLTALVKQADLFDGFSKEKQKGLLEYGLHTCRDLFLWQQGAADLLRLPDDELTFVKNFAKVLTPAHIERIVADLNEAIFHLERNARAKMVLLDMSLTFSRIIRATA